MIAGSGAIAASRRRMSSLLLDVYPMKAAYSYRKLRANYNGACCRLLRQADSYEEDIFWLNDVVNTTRITQLATAQNLLLQSEDFGAGSWSKTQGSVTTNATADPDGVMVADRLTDGSSININQAITTVANQRYDFSCYLKKSGSQNFADLYIFRIGSGFVSWARFNLNDGTIASQTYGTGATIEYAGNDWWRCSVNGTHAGTMTSFGVYNTTEVFAVRAQVNTSSMKAYARTTTVTLDSSSLSLRKKYDQMNGFDLEQSISNQQPRVASNGVIDTEGGKITTYFDGDNHYLQNTDIVVTQPNTIFLATRYRTGAANCNALDGISSRQAIYSDGSSNISFFAGSTQGSSTAWGTSTFRLVTAMFNGGSSKLRNNGIEILAGNPGTNDLNGLYVGGWGGVSNWGGNISELLISDNDETPNFSAIEANANGYYSFS